MALAAWWHGFICCRRGEMFSLTSGYAKTPTAVAIFPKEIYK
jgi:hypothetical protein